jgi:hypothetical protein
MARGVVGVQVGIDNVSDVVVALDGQINIGLDIQLRIDDGGSAALARGKKIRGAASFVVQELFEVHWTARTPRAES